MGRPPAPSTFPAGTTTRTVNVPVYGDTQHEEDETFLLELSGPFSAGLADAEGTGTITNDDTANEVPTATDDAYSVDEDGELKVDVPGVLGNDSDPESASLSAIRVSDPAHGLLSLRADGSLTYRPEKDYNGEDSFTYKVSDGANESSVATVKITVDPVDEEPPPQPNTRPKILNPLPAPDSTIRGRTPTISARITDAETNLSKENVELFLDGKKVTGFSYNRTTDRLSYTSGKLKKGRHTVVLNVSDGQGQSESRVWGFRVR